jgi:hypothetical protein
VSATYTLGYYPENKKFDGKYRSIKVKVKKDGVELQNRRGYYAIDPAQIKGYSAQQEVASALHDAAPSTLVGFSARVRLASANSTPGKVGVDFLVDASTLSTEDTSAGNRLNLGFCAPYSRLRERCWRNAASKWTSHSKQTFTSTSLTKVCCCTWTLILSQEITNCGWPFRTIKPGSSERSTLH